MKGISFWVAKEKKDRFLSNVKGLSKLEIEMPKSLEEGDRFILYHNTKDYDSSPDYSLKVIKKDNVLKK